MAAMGDCARGVFKCFADEILIRIFFGFCPDEISNGSIRCLSSFYRDFVSKYAPSALGLRNSLYAAAVPHCFGASHGFTSVNVSGRLSGRSPVPPTFVELPNPPPDHLDAGRGVVNNNYGAAEFTVPGIPPGVFSKVCCSQARIVLLSLGGAPFQSAAAARWKEILCENSDGLAKRKKTLGTSRFENAAGTYQELQALFSYLPELVHLLVLSFPVLGRAEWVHMFIPMRVPPGYGFFLHRESRSGLVSKPGGIENLSWDRYYLDLTCRASVPWSANPIGNAEPHLGYALPAIITTVHRTELPCLVQDPGVVSRRRHCFISDFRKFQKAFRLWTWSTDDWIMSTAYTLTTHTEHLYREIIRLLTSGWSSFGPSRHPRIGVGRNASRWLYFAKASLLAELVFNTVVAPDQLGEICGNCAGPLFEMCGRTGTPAEVGRFQREVEAGIGRICSDIRPLLWGGRLQLVVGHVCPEPHVGVHGSARHPIKLWIVLDGSDFLTVCNGTMKRTAFNAHAVHQMLWTKLLRTNRKPVFNVANFYAAAYASGQPIV